MDLVSDIQPFHGKPCTIFSLDIKDLYYSLQPAILLSRVRLFLEENLVRFQSQSGMEINEFLRILELYLRSTVVNHNEQKYIQRQGVCIGSAVAPALSEIYLRSLDLKVHEMVKNCNPDSVLIRRYVDDILVCVLDSAMAGSIENTVYREAPELQFSIERPGNNVLQYLDLQLRLVPGLCWSYGKVKPKPILPFDSCHSKHIKAGLVRNMINNAVQRSCCHSIWTSIQGLLSRLSDAKYPQEFLTKQLSYIVASGKKDQKKSEHKTFVVIPFFHRVSHNLKSIGEKFG
ncbi:unnamed protein product [Ixodes hexagonus]